MQVSCNVFVCPRHLGAGLFHVLAAVAHLEIVSRPRRTFDTFRKLVKVSANIISLNDTIFGACVDYWMTRTFLCFGAKDENANQSGLGSETVSWGHHMEIGR